MASSDIKCSKILFVLHCILIVKSSTSDSDIEDEIRSLGIQNRVDFVQRVINNNKPVIVDFWSLQCDPCKIMFQKIRRIVDEQQGKIVLVTVNIQEHMALREYYDILSIPCLLAFRHGKAEDRLVGLVSDDDIKMFVTRYVDAAK